MTASAPQEGEVRYTGPAPEVYLDGHWQVMGDEGISAPVDDVQTVFFKGHDDDPDG
ncbi:hypothetical protein [Streptomyces sp. NPDC087859]|uniref:hypothetical protein n=1 Tax=Streptomyces sp. NPDC087859 TaxID=3365812 RepID=UPI0038197DF9